MNHSRILTALCAAVLPFALAFAAQGCGNKDNDVPTQPSSTPVPPPPPPPAPPVELKTEEDAGAGADAATDAATDAAVKATGSGADPTGVRKCCTALRQNANSAPLDQKGPMLSAAAMCDGLVNSPQGRQALVSVRGLLKSANVPADCK